MELKYKRVLLKLSGEALKGNKESGIDFDKTIHFAKQIKSCVDKGLEVAVVIGGGNFWRGRSNTMMDSCTSDSIGMLATTMNALALNDALLQIGQESRVQTAIEMNKIAEYYIRTRAIKHLEKKRVLIFAAGVGSPFFSTDTAAALRAAEINADIILKATTVDGVYTSDPKKDEFAQKLEEVSYKEVIKNELKVMDSTAASLCMNSNIPMIVFDCNNEENLEKIILGEKIGTIVKNR